MTQEIVDALATVRKKLVNIGARGNRLIYVKRAAAQSKTLNIINERAEDVYKILRTDGRKMKFKAMGKDDEQDKNEIVLDVRPDPEEPEFDQARSSDNLLETPLGPDRLQKRLIHLARDARTAEEEQGVNILYLAIGFLKWFEDKSSSVEREAPLILVPVELTRSERGSNYDIKARDDDIDVNSPLKERLKADFGVSLPDIDDSEQWTPDTYFSKVEDAISNQSKWSIDKDGMQLGFFSFAKLLMWRDLDPKKWPDSSLEKNELVARLLGEGFEGEAPLFSPDDKLDEVLNVSELFHVVDADASQTKVIEEVRAGRNLVVQGPPGTGKSQTIANILAAAVVDDKKVLFVAEKMAALDVVYHRMNKANLDHLCLEIHSRNANKKAFLGELKRTLDAGRAATAVVSDTKSLQDTQDKLNQIAQAMHSRAKNRDYTAFEALSELIWLEGKEYPPSNITDPSLDKVTNETYRQQQSLIEDYVALLGKYGSRKTHPFYGVGATSLQPPDKRRMKQEAEEALNSHDELRKELARITKRVEVPHVSNFAKVSLLIEFLDHIAKAPDRLETMLPNLIIYVEDPRLKKALDAGDKWKTENAQILQIFNEIAKDCDVTEIRSTFAKAKGSAWVRWFGKYRSASSELSTLMSGPLPKSCAERLELVDQLLIAQQLQKKFTSAEKYLETILKVHWQGLETDFGFIKNLLEWLSQIDTNVSELSEVVILNAVDLLGSADFSLDELKGLITNAQQKQDKLLDRLDHQTYRSGECDDVEADEIRTFMQGILDNFERYDEHSKFAHQIVKIKEAGLNRLLHMVDEEIVKPSNAVIEWRYAISQSRWSYISKTIADIDLQNIDRKQLVQLFQNLERKRTKDVQSEIRSNHLQQLPRGSTGEMGFLRAEIGKKTRHRSIRKIIENAHNMVQRIKPVLLMSPISVAQFLPANTIEFDLLVIDEASQVRPEDALGAIARAKQIVIVGDDKQLPPTSFFDRMTDNSEDDDDDDAALAPAGAGEMESILTLCEARGMQQSMLEWHYRSRDPSLITISNEKFYQNNLILPPSPFQDDPEYGLSFTKVSGVYSSESKGGGRRGTNRIEAEAVVEALIAYAAKRPTCSIGIVTFSKAQSDTVTEALEVKRRQNIALDTFLRENKSESVFVKNIENVQGDERDVILISVGYGPHEPNGKLASMNFGPINNDGGDRRLNVLFSRARVRCEVFCSFEPSEIVISRTSKDGPTVLKRFLDFAQTGLNVENLPSGNGADSPFEEDVASVVRGMGYEAHHQVGSAGFFIDLGVIHKDLPGKYVLAIECDGATYHSALWARERDRLRQDVLEGLGWKFHRIWSTDWFYRRKNEIDKLRLAIEKAITDANSSHNFVGANADGPTVLQAENEAPIKNENIIGAVVHEYPKITAPAYVKSSFTIDSHRELHEYHTSQLSNFAFEVVQTEGPVHTDEVAKRLTNGFGKTRVGGRIQEAVLSALKYATKAHGIKGRKDFWFTVDQLNKVPIRDRSAEVPPTTKAEHLSEMEIAAAAQLIEAESGSMDIDEMTVSIARLLGYQRAGPDIKKVIKKALKA